MKLFRPSLVLLAVILLTGVFGITPVRGHLCQGDYKGLFEGISDTYSIFGSVDATYQVTDVGDTNIVSISPLTLGAMPTGVFTLLGVSTGRTEISIYWKGVVEAGDDDEGTCTFTVEVFKDPGEAGGMSFFYPLPSTNSPVATLNLDILPGGVETHPILPNEPVFLNRDFRDRPLGFSGGAVLSCDQPIVGVVNLPVFPDNGGPGFRCYPPPCVPAPEINLAMMKKVFFDASSEVVVQNTDTIAAQVTLRFSGLDITDSLDLEIGQYLNYDMIGSPVPDGWFGTVRCESDGANIVAINRETGPGGLQSVVAGFPHGGDTRVFIPNVVSQPNLITHFQIIDTSDSAREATVFYYDPNGNLVQSVSPFPVGPGDLLDPVVDHGLPPGFQGSAIIQADGPIFAVAAEQRGNTAPSFFPAIPANNNDLYLPLIIQDDAPNHSFIHIQNADPTPADMTVNFYGRDPFGAEIRHTETISLPANATSETTPEVLINLFPNGFQGAVQIESSGSSCAVTASVGPPSTLCTYAGIPADEAATTCYIPRMNGNSVPLFIDPPFINNNVFEFNWTDFGPGYVYIVERNNLQGAGFQPVPPYDVSGPTSATHFDFTPPDDGGVLRLQIFDALP